jgi:hypothetical protein
VIAAALRIGCCITSVARQEEMLGPMQQGSSLPEPPPIDVTHGTRERHVSQDTTQKILICYLLYFVRFRLIATDSELARFEVHAACSQNLRHVITACRDAQWCSGALRRLHFSGRVTPA